MFKLGNYVYFFFCFSWLNLIGYSVVGELICCLVELIRFLWEFEIWILRDGVNKMRMVLELKGYVKLSFVWKVEEVC